MACVGPKSTCRSPGVGPHCDPTSITMRGDTTGLLPDGITSVKMKHDPQSTLGSERKAKCIADEKTRVERELHSCMCDCIERHAFPSFGEIVDIAGNGNGVSLYCFGRCYESAETSMDWTKCYCMETRCGSDSANNSKDTIKSADPTKTQGGDSSSLDPGSNPTIKYDFAKLGPQIDVVRSASSYDLHIPKIYNRGVVGGNIIWIGNPRQIVKHVVETTTDDSGNLTITDTEVTQSFVDFAIALCEGPIDGVARLWLNDILVYNNVLPVDSNGVVQPESGGFVLARDNFGFFDKIDNKDKYTNTIAKIAVYNGDEDQLPSVPGHPGYRGIAYILVQNFDLSFTEGEIPNMRVDVIQRQLQVPIHQIGSTLALPPHIMYADESTRRVVLNGEVYDYDSLDSVGTLVPVPDSALAGNSLGDLAFWGGGELVYANLATGTVGATLGDVAQFTAGAFVTPREVSSALPAYYVGATRNTLNFWRVDDFGGTWTDKGTIPNIAPDKISYLIPFSATENDVNVNYVVAVSAPEVSLSHIRVQHVLLYDSKYHQTFNAATPIISHDNTIPNTLWGRETTAVLTSVIRDARDDGLIFFVKGTYSAYAFKWDYVTGAFAWAWIIPSTPAGTFTISPNTSCDDVYFVGEDGILYGMALMTGSMTQGDSVDVVLGAPQHFDVSAAALTYVSSSNVIARKFIGRMASGPISVADIIYDLMEMSGLDSSGIDISQITSVPAHGYVITNQTTARAALTQLMFFFGLTARETSGVITFTETALALNTPITYDEFSESSSSYERTAVDAGVKHVDVGYLAVEAAFTETHQVVRLAGNDGLSEATFSFPIVLTTAEAGRVAERLAASLALDNVTASVKVGQAHIALEPGDYVTLYDSSGAPTQFRVEQTNLGRDAVMELSLIKDTLSLYTETSGLNPVVVSTGSAADTSAFAPSSALRPLIVLTNSVTNADIPDAVTGKYVSGFYGGVDYRGPLPMVETPLYVETGGVMTINARVTEPMYWGSVISVSPVNDSSVYTTDDDESVVIRFVRDDFEVNFVQDATTHALDDTTVNMLIVNDELIQFKNYSIDVDGHTVTFTNLLRGRRGTEWASADQRNAGVAILYTKNGCAPMSQTASYTPQVLTIGVKTGDARFSKANRINHHAMLRPYAPSNFKVNRLLTGDKAFSFERRTRYGEADNDGTVTGLISTGGVLSGADGTVVRDFDDVRSFDIYILKRDLPLSYVRDIADYLEIPGVASHPEVYRWIKAYNMAPIALLEGVYVNVPFTALYTATAQAADGFDSANGTLYIAVYQRGGEFVNRGHPLYVTIEPTQ